jgi:Novel STAND NTPase 2
MEGSPFRVRGIEIADCRGRTLTLQRVRNELVNNQVSIVGPRHGGKTVLMHRLATKIDEDGGQFAGSLLWNLKETRFTSDGDFLDEFRNRLVEPLRRIDDGLVKDLQTDGWSSLEAVQTVFEWLHNSGKCLVVCMDGFDALPIGTALTAGLLENLRSLAVKCTKSIRFVITSRKPLRDLCASLETADSPFHNLFPDPVVLQALTRQEVEEFVTPFRDAGVTVARGADTEIFNWSGGFPLLVSMLGQRLWARLSAEHALSPEIVNEEGAELLNDSSGYLQDLWDDCTPEQKEILTSVATGRADEFTGSSARHVRPLVQRGYLARVGNRVQFQCRAMRSVAEGELGAQSELMTNLFGTADRFGQNVRVLLQYRLAARAPIDEHLLRVTEKIIDAFDDPNTSLALFREAARQLLFLVWRRVLPDRRIPVAWTEHWRSLNERNIRATPFNSIPADGSQCRLLDQLTGQHRPTDTCIRRSTYLLLDSLWGIGDYGQHRDTEEIQLGFLVCSCFTLLEAWAQLEVDLQRA